MTEQVAIIPLAVAMVIGPQTISAVFFAASRDPIRNSLAFVAAVAVAGGTLVHPAGPERSAAVPLTTPSRGFTYLVLG